MGRSSSGVPAIGVPMLYTSSLLVEEIGGAGVES
jgi:hypothetical protein